MNLEEDKKEVVEMVERQPQRDRGLVRELEKLKREHMEEALRKVREFNKTPKEVKEYLDRFVIGQDAGKKVLSLYIACHFKDLSDMINREIQTHGNLDEMFKQKMRHKENILIIGPTGVGKSYTIEVLCRPDFLGIPFTIEDMTKFSEAGYVGSKVEEIPYNMLVNANFNVYLAQLGVYYLDCIDKIKKAQGLIGRDVSGEGVQNSLLRPIEGTTVTLPKYLESKVPSISTNLNLFVASGVFDGLQDIVEERIEKEGRRCEDWRREMKSEDLIEFGMIPEFVRRFPVRVFYNQLTENDLVRIMKESEDSPVNTYKERARKWGIDLRFTQDALEEIAKYAVREKMGAGGIITIMTNILTDDFFEKFGYETGTLEINGQYVRERLR